MQTRSTTTTTSEQLKSLSKKINNFDYHFEMSDSNQTYSRGSRQKVEINNELESMTQDQLQELRSLIIHSDECISRYFKSFVGITNEPVEDQQEASKEIETESTSTEDQKPESANTRIFKAAWFYFKKRIYLSFSKCLKAAWRAHKIRKALKLGKVSFSFRKSTGEIRDAIGTLNGDLFKYTKKGVRKPSNPDTVKYFDLEAESWKAFRIERLLNVAV